MAAAHEAIDWWLRSRMATGKQRRLLLACGMTA
jgi:hypothetical protein